MPASLPTRASRCRRSTGATKLCAPGSSCAASPRSTILAPCSRAWASPWVRRHRDRDQAQEPRQLALRLERDPCSLASHTLAPGVRLHPVWSTLHAGSRRACFFCFFANSFDPFDSREGQFDFLRNTLRDRSTEFRSLDRRGASIGGTRCPLGVWMRADVDVLRVGECSRMVGSARACHTSIMLQSS